MHSSLVAGRSWRSRLWGLCRRKPGLTLAAAVLSNLLLVALLLVARVGGFVSGFWAHVCISLPVIAGVWLMGERRFGVWCWRGWRQNRTAVVSACTAVAGYTFAGLMAISRKAKRALSSARD